MTERIGLAGPVVFFTGAGIAVSAGLPTYRGSGGLYTNSAFEPPTVDDITVERLPTLWSRFRDRLDAATAISPTPAHLAIAAMEASADVTVVTQNVDGLHRAAGSSAVHELHGSLSVLRCLDFGHESDITALTWSREGVPLCPECGAWCRPGVVLFGEALPTGTWRDAERAMSSANSVVAVGTSAEVYPAAGLLDPRACPAATRVWINPEKEPPTSGWTWLRGSADAEVARLECQG